MADPLEVFSEQSLALFFQRQSLLDELSSFVLAEVVVVLAKKPDMVTSTFPPLCEVFRKPIVDGPELPGLIGAQSEVGLNQAVSVLFQCRRRPSGGFAWLAMGAAMAKMAIATTMLSRRKAIKG